MFIKKLITILFLSLFLYGSEKCSLHALEIPSYNVILDPGHGGASILKDGKTIYSDRWDPITQTYLSPFNTGMHYNGYQEHLVVLALAKEVKRYLDLSCSKWTWKFFEKILKKLSPQEKFPRICIDSTLTRKDSWNHRYRKTTNPAINAPYRMFDYPDNKNRMRLGRLSFINQKKPSLVVSLHMTPAGKESGGMAAVLSPGYRTFNMLRRIHLDKEPFSKWKRSIWRGKFLWGEAGWRQYALARSDAWVYFHGFPSNHNGKEPRLEINRGIRQNLITWKYQADPSWIKNYNPTAPGPYSLNYKHYKPIGKFWDRERSIAEQWRREDGPLKYGGDNHYASDELLRFVQQGVRALNKKFQEGGDIGPIYQPYVSAYTLPIYVNAIVAYLEIGHLNRAMDRNLIIKHKKIVAQSLAIGIYSLYAGLKLNAIKNPFTPRGKKLDFKKYKNLPEGNYFQIVSD